MKKIAFGTIVHPNSMAYINEFVESINSQINKNFEVLIINDDVDEKELNKQVKKIDLKCNILNNKDNKTPAELRVDLIKESKKRAYDLLILGDSDDIFDKNRVEKVIATWEKTPNFEFYYNNILLFDGSYVFKKIPKITKKIASLLQYNYLGLSNTAINLSRISNEFIESLYECTSFVFDWYLYSRILCNGGKGIFVEDAISYYRIYDGNFLGVPNEKQLTKEYDVKLKHYTLMAEYDQSYVYLLKKIKKIDVTKLIAKKEVSFWWNNIEL